MNLKNPVVCRLRLAFRAREDHWHRRGCGALRCDWWWLWCRPKVVVVAVQLADSGHHPRPPRRCLVVLLACVGRRWLLLACVGRRWLLLACVRHHSS